MEANFEGVDRWEDLLTSDPQWENNGESVPTKGVEECGGRSLTKGDNCAGGSRMIRGRKGV